MNLLSARVPNQLVQNGNFESGINQWSSTNGAYTSISAYNGKCKCTQIQASTIEYRSGVQTSYGSYQLAIISGHKYFCGATCNIPYSTSVLFALKRNYESHSSQAVQYTIPNIDQRLHAIVTATANGNCLSVWPNPTPMAVGTEYYLDDIVCIDLTELYGAGLEPTLEQFKQDYPLDYYPYSLTSYTGLLQQNGKAVTADIASLLSDNLVLIDLENIEYIIDEQSTDYKLYKSTTTHTNIVRPTNNNNIPAIVSEFYGVVQLYAMPTSSTINKVSLSTGGFIFVETPPNEIPKGYIIGTKA